MRLEGWAAAKPLGFGGLVKNVDPVLRLPLVLKVISRGSHDQKATEEIRPGGPSVAIEF